MRNVTRAAARRQGERSALTALRRFEPSKARSWWDTIGAWPNRRGLTLARAKSIGPRLAIRPTPGDRLLAVVIAPEGRTAAARLGTLVDCLDDDSMVAWARLPEPARDPYGANTALAATWLEPILPFAIATVAFGRPVPFRGRSLNTCVGIRLLEPAHG